MHERVECDKPAKRCRRAPRFKPLQAKLSGFLPECFVQIGSRFDFHTGTMRLIHTGAQLLLLRIERYAASHTNPVNRLCHTFGIPLIALSVPLFAASPFVSGLWRVPTAFFLLGWTFQFVGHYFEGRKPAFVDDLAGLLVGPMFVTAEVLFALGLCQPLHAGV